MRTIGLVSLVILTSLVLVTTIQAAPRCCDPTQGQAQTGIFPSTPQAGSTFPVAPRNAYTQQVSQTAREIGPVPKNPRVSQPSMPCCSVPPVRTTSAVPQANTVPGLCGPGGCGARNITADYQVAKGSCCGGNAYGPKQVEQRTGSVPDCCSGKIQAAAPKSSCCAGQMKPAVSAPNCCAVGSKTTAPAVSAPNCCAAGPKTAGPAVQLPKNTNKVSSSPLPLQATVVRADVQSQMVSAMKIPSNGAPVLRFGSLW